MIKYLCLEDFMVRNCIATLSYITFFKDKVYNIQTHLSDGKYREIFSEELKYLDTIPIIKINQHMVLLSEFREQRINKILND